MKQQSQRNSAYGTAPASDTRSHARAASICVARITFRAFSAVRFAVLAALTFLVTPYARMPALEVGELVRQHHLEESYSYAPFAMADCRSLVQGKVGLFSGSTSARLHLRSARAAVRPS